MRTLTTLRLVLVILLLVAFSLMIIGCETEEERKARLAQEAADKAAKEAEDARKEREAATREATWAELGMESDDSNAFQETTDTEVQEEQSGDTDTDTEDDDD